MTCSEYKNDEVLQSRFKKRDMSRTVRRHIPQRLKMTANPEESQMCGYLKLKSGRGGKWRSSWWVLKDKVMYRFSAAEDIVAQETIPVLGWSLETLSDVRLKIEQ